MRAESAREGKETKQKSLVASLPSLRVLFSSLIVNIAVAVPSLLSSAPSSPIIIVIAGLLSTGSLRFSLSRRQWAPQFLLFLSPVLVYIIFIALGIRILVTILFGSSLRRWRRCRRSESFARSVLLGA